MLMRTRWIRGLGAGMLGVGLLVGAAAPAQAQSTADDSNPYTGAAGAAALARIPGAHRVYADAGVRFEYPADATVQLQGHTTQLLLVGPDLHNPLFQGPDYQVAITRLPQPVTGPLDAWGAAQVAQETADRARAGVLDPPPLATTFFHLANRAVYQIDWFLGDSVDREFYVAPAGGGPVVRLITRVYPVENNAGAPQAESAVTLLLYTLTMPEPGPVPGMPSTGAPAAPTLGALLALAAALAVLGGVFRRRAGA